MALGHRMGGEGGGFEDVWPVCLAGLSGSWSSFVVGMVKWRSCTASCR